LIERIEVMVGLLVVRRVGSCSMLHLVCAQITKMFSKPNRILSKLN
jgi:hypothetical protein